MTDAERRQYAALRQTTDELSDLELFSLNNAVNFPGFDLKQLSFYEKVKHLFAEDGGERMHDEVIDLLSVIVLDRLTGSERRVP